MSSRNERRFGARQALHRSVCNESEVGQSVERWLPPRSPRPLGDCLGASNEGGDNDSAR